MGLTKPWTWLRGIRTEAPRPATEYSPGQLELLSGVRLRANKDMNQIIENASLDDLEWFQTALSHQLDTTPLYVKDEEDLAGIQEWHLKVRTITGSILQNKRIAARRRDRRASLRKDIVLLVTGAVLGSVLGAILTLILVA